MSLVKFVKGDTTSLNSTYRRQGTGNIEFDSTTKKIYLDGVNYTGEVDSELTQRSNNPVSSSALYKVITENELTTAAALTEHEDRLDGLDETVAGKQDALTFDTTPTASSLNPVTSSGIKKYVDDAIDANAPMTEITYSDLVTARNNNNLKPGTWYRITDYQCITTQENTQSAGHQFDIVLLALSENKLAEEGWAMMHPTDVYDVTFSNGVTKKCYLYKQSIDGISGNAVLVDSLLGVEVADFSSEFTIDEENKTATTEWDYTELTTSDLTYNYFQNSNLSAWKVWYCLDNDKSRFAWADDNLPSIVDEDTIYVRKPSSDIGDLFAWYNENDNIYDYTKTEHPSIGDETFDEEGGTNANVSNVFGFGRGVIYRLIDEFNNDIKYDFKNIQFKRKLTNGQYDATNGTDTWCYTLNLWYNDMCQDASIVGNTLPGDDGYILGVYDNVFGYATAYDFSLEGVNTFAFALGDNVVLSFDNDGYFGIYSNTIGNNFFSNTIGDSFCANTIGDNFNSNTIGNNPYANTIGNDFNFNTIGDNLYSNTIGNSFNGNTFGNNFHSNTIGDNLYSNTIGNSFNGNTIGNEFNGNTIGNSFDYNTIGNVFRSNTIGNSFNGNTIGNFFQFNTIGVRNSNTITTIDYVRYIRVEDGVQYVDITTSATTSSSNWLQNITIAQGVRGTSASTRKVITHGTLNDTFRTTYQPANSQTVSV